MSDRSVAAVLDTAYTDGNVARVVAAREETRETLLAAGIRVLPSATNFLFVQADPVDAAPVQRALREEGILVRHFSSEKLRPWLRVSMGTEEEMRTVAQALIRLIKK